MRSLLVAASIILLPVSAQAIGRYDVDRMGCQQVQAIVLRDHAAILRYHSPRSGLVLYDRYVSDSRFCPAYTSPVRDYIRTADDPACPVYHCLNDGDIPGSLGDR